MNPLFHADACWKHRLGREKVVYLFSIGMNREFIEKPHWANEDIKAVWMMQMCIVTQTQQKYVNDNESKVNGDNVKEDSIL
jgi:hypothetical protein